MSAPQYVEQRNGGYYVAGSRVSLASIVYEFRASSSPETIRQNFPTLTLEQVYGAITFYLANQAETTNYLAEQEAQWEKKAMAAQPVSADLQRRSAEARKRSLTSQV